jgi:rhamnogalacturonyl hydrolase YesR
MNRKALLLYLGLQIFTGYLCAQSAFDKGAVKAVMDKVNNYQRTHPHAAYDDNWIRGTYYTGVMACFQATGDKAYLAQCDSLGEALQWKIPADKRDSQVGGGNLLTLGQTWIESYVENPEEKKIAPIVAHLENPALNNPVSRPLDWYWEGGRRYVDGLFTGPPTLAMLYSVTKNEKYLQWTDAFVWDVYGQLFDCSENLFYRDEHFFPTLMKTAKGKKVIWSRGNGWAFAALARLLKYIPQDYATYPRYEQVFRLMAKELKKRQSPEGFWYPNLDDPDDFRVRETSGTSFFVYGLAYGVNTGLLDREEYLPVIEKAWQLLCSSVSGEGMLQWGQRVGDRPVEIKQEDSHEYVSGTFLLAASEVYKLSALFIGEDPVDWEMSGYISRFLTDIKKAPKQTPTQLSRNDYLKIIESQTRAMRGYQDASGRIIDPVKKEEMYYSTPCYAHSVAALAATGYTKDKELIESGMLAMDVVTSDMAANYSAGKHGDFYTWPVLLALKQFESVASPERLAKWRKNLANIDISKFYQARGAVNGKWQGKNWNVCNLTGEFLRWREGMTALSYTDSCLKYQTDNITPYGTYFDGEGSAPFAYDLFPRHYLSGMLKMGYRGVYFEPYRELLLKGAWTSLFLQSPFGEIPAGFRSAHHIWNESEQCVVFELFASEYARKGERVKAEIFKRAARLSLQSVASWLRPDGSGYIVKNKFPLEAQHGYEVYSVHACYNMLATSMLAQAWQFAEEDIAEGVAPADIGGYVVSLPAPFHKIVASVAGTYVEYETKGDQAYNPTGIIRVHIRGSHPQLGPSDGCASKFGGKDVSVAVGPSWQNADGSWSSLASWQQSDPTVEVIEESLKRSRFKISYSANNVTVSETVTVEKGKITVEDELSGDVAKMRVTFPMLTFNGKEETAIQTAKNTATLSLEGKRIRFTALAPNSATLVRSGKKYGHRNGMVEPLYFEVQGNKAKYSINMP